MLISHSIIISSAHSSPTMTARPPPELAGELYCRANLDPMIYTGMSPQIATELLDRAWHMLSQGQISFSYNYIDKPKEGSGFFLKVQPDEITMPHDGFQYMDDEISYPFPLDPRVTITERSQGFAHGEQYTHIVRRKYTLVMPGRETLAFLHYSKADVGRSVVVDGRRAKTPARQYPLKPIPGVAPMAGQQQAPAGYPPHQTPQQQQTPVPQQPAYRAQQQPPKMNSPYGASPIMGSPASPQQPPSQQQGYGRFPGGPIAGPPGGPPQQGMPPQRLSSINSNAYGNQRHDKKSGGHKKHPQQQPQQPQLTPQQQREVQMQREAQMQEDTEEPSGDELDFLTARDVAIARYKRNHDYVAEVFSPYPTSRIIPPNSEYQKSIEFLKSLGGTQQQDEELDQIKSEHDDKIKRFKAEASVFYKGLEDLKQATTVQEVFAANERVEVYKGMTVQPYLGLRQMDLPKDESTRTPELKPAKVVKQATSVAPAVPTAVAHLELDAPLVAPLMSMEVEVGGVPSDVPATATPSAISHAMITPAVSAPLIDTTAMDSPAMDAPAIHAPALDTPAMDTSMDTPTIDMPVIDTPAIDTPAIDTPAIVTPAIDTPAIVTPAIDTPAIGLQVHIQQEISAAEGVVTTPIVEAVIDKRAETALDNWSAPVAAVEGLASTFTQSTEPVASPPAPAPAPTTALETEMSSSSMEVDNSPSNNAAAAFTSAPSFQEIPVDVPVPTQAAIATETPQQEAAAAPVTPIHVPAEEPVADAAVVVASVQPVEPSTPVSLPGSVISSNMDVDSNVPTTEATPVVTSEPSPVAQDAEMTPITAGDVTSASPAAVAPVSEQEQLQQPLQEVIATESSLDQTEAAPEHLSHPPSL